MSSLVKQPVPCDRTSELEQEAETLRGIRDDIVFGRAPGLWTRADQEALEAVEASLYHYELDAMMEVAA